MTFDHMCLDCILPWCPYTWCLFFIFLCVCVCELFSRLYGVFMFCTCWLLLCFVSTRPVLHYSILIFLTCYFCFPSFLLLFLLVMYLCYCYLFLYPVYPNLVYDDGLILISSCIGIMCTWIVPWFLHYLLLNCLYIMCALLSGGNKRYILSYLEPLSSCPHNGEDNWNTFLSTSYGENWPTYFSHLSLFGMWSSYPHTWNHSPHVPTTVWGQLKCTSLKWLSIR